ncbi:hypothetical protein DSO57_1005214 [Entomophthora muscae]|uniref:Uncharacterized protein n=1 Tax=Entomophthora muscae TaxID=34485 RepID=A0ACC2T7Y2_9FUNG|nr:hypothetical protein DSO57_1005214 [Entomophthora muscae]
MRVTLSYTDAIPLYLNYISVIGTDIPGALNLVALLIDPAFSAAISAIKAQRKQDPTSTDDKVVLEIHNPEVASALESHPQDHLTNEIPEFRRSQEIEEIPSGNQNSIRNTRQSTHIAFHSNLSSITPISLAEKL